MTEALAFYRSGFQSINHSFRHHFVNVIDFSRRIVYLGT
jgi:hypothetical protein